jgi:glycosyltransferase involved in cell wall biosynthesis
MEQSATQAAGSQAQMQNSRNGLKILVLSHEYPPIGGGGGRVVADLSSGLAARGHKVRVITAHWGDLPKLAEVDGVTIQRLPSCRRQSFRADLKAMACYVWRAFWQGWKAAREWQPDLIHAHFAVPAGAAAAALSRVTGIPYVITAHGGDVPGGAPEKTHGWFRFVLPLSKPIWRNAAAIATVSNQTRQLALAHYPVAIEVIPNGIDLAGCQPASLVPNDPPRILYIGRFSPEKNAAMVPQVLSRLADLPWQCTMLGDGPQMAQVRDVVGKSGLADRIALPGWAEPESVVDWLAKSDILFMPSLREAMPMAGLQALAMGLAIVISRIGSCPDLVADGENGFLVAPGDEGGYVQALHKLLADRALLARCRKNSHSKASAFDMPGMIDRYMQLYAAALSQERAG